MSYEYDMYLTEHRMNVMRAFDWLRKNVFDETDFVSRFVLSRVSEHIVHHDESKYSTDEYMAYDKYFYGPEEYKESYEEAFNYAWLHHIHNNPHHWQHWVLVNDDPELGTVALEMSNRDAIEMICDWWSFSWKSGDLFEIFNWYEKNKDHMILHENTRKYVEDILEKIKTKLEEN